MTRRKQRVMINLPPELVTKARNLGLNISKVSENALIDIIKRIESYNHQNNQKKTQLNKIMET